MKPVRRFFRRYIVSVTGSVILFLTVNVLLILGVFTAGYGYDRYAAFSIRAFSAHIVREGDAWIGDEEALTMLQETDAWAMVLDEGGQVVWEQELPEELPRWYSAADVASFSRWYLEGYPVKVWAREDGFLAVVGFTPETWVKYYFSVDRDYFFLVLLGGCLIFLANIGLLIFLTLRNARRVGKAMSPILQGIQDLAAGSPRPLKERGELAEISHGLNQAGEYLAKKDNTRAEWIRGVSHDIRTPLSMVLGYASELEENSALPPDARKQATVIRRQGERLKGLVESLNLTTKLEYALQPVCREQVDGAELGRKAVSELLNQGLPERYVFEFSQEPPGKAVWLEGDPALLRRMIDNLLINSVVHNPEGCHIGIKVKAENSQCVFEVWDDGKGIDAAFLARLNGGRQDGEVVPKGGLGKPEHGLGLKIVRQIVQAHGGRLIFEEMNPHGLKVRIALLQHGKK